MEPPPPHPCCWTFCLGSRSGGGLGGGALGTGYWPRGGPWPSWAQLEGWVRQGVGAGPSRVPLLPTPPWDGPGVACSGLLPVPFRLCHMNFVTSSLFSSVSSFVKWKEGCQAGLEVGGGLAGCCSSPLGPWGVGPWDLRPGRRWAWLWVLSAEPTAPGAAPARAPWSVWDGFVLPAASTPRPRSQERRGGRETLPRSWLYNYYCDLDHRFLGVRANVKGGESRVHPWPGADSWTTGRRCPGGRPGPVLHAGGWGPAQRLRPRP